VAGVVLDASTALAFVIPDEKRPLREVVEIIETAGAIVPLSWRLEVANALYLAERNKRITPSFRRNALDDLSALPIATDTRTLDFAWTETYALAQRHRLTTYDAAYLELAIREGLPLATRDEGLRLGAMRAKVRLLD
jgi:predicted nucleic acid-binding protein